MRGHAFAFALVCGVRLLGCDGRFDFDVPKHADEDGGLVHEGGAGSGAFEASPGDADSRADVGSVLDADAAGDATNDASRTCLIELSTCETVGLHCDALSGSCVECLQDADCAALGLARCDVAAHRCVQCGLDQDCAADYACEPLARVCVKRCREDVDCGSANLACDELRGVCIACANDANCEHAVSGPLCVRGGSSCVACRSDSDCSFPTRHCDAVSNRCVMCRDSRDCLGDHFCSPLVHLCIDLDGR
jgi:hypothetical protein